jgi:hypothetical protein
MKRSNRLSHPELTRKMRLDPFGDQERPPRVQYEALEAFVARIVRCPPPASMTTITSFPPVSIPEPGLEPPRHSR